VIRLISVPYDSGQYGRRMGYGPIRLIQNDLVGRMRSKAGDVEAFSVEVHENFSSEISTTFRLLENIKYEVAVAFARKQFPLVLSGNCSASAGVVAAYNKRSVGVIWFDAHADCESPDTTTSGFLDGMALSMLLGKSWKNKMKALIIHGMKGHQIVLIGSRDISAFEKEFIAENKIHFIPIDGLRSDPQRLLNVRQSLINADIDALHLHVDVDVIDPAVGIANSYSAPGGLFTKEVTATIELFQEKIPITSAAISSYDPSYDKRGEVFYAIEEIINCIIQ
jgi:arginase